MSDPNIQGIENPVEAILAASPDCLKVLSAEGVVRFVNDSGLALMEVDSQETMRGMYYPDIWPKEMRQRVKDAIKKAATGLSTRVEGYCPTFKGTPRWWEASFRGVQASAGIATEVIGVTRDISDRRARELSLRTKEESLASELSHVDRRTTEFIATLAHELRNPLAPIRTGLRLMREAGDDAAALGRVREMMERQVGQMVHLIGDLLDIARVTSGRMELRKERVELHEVIEKSLEACNSFISSGQHSLDVHLPDEPLHVDGDATRLVQVFTNLLNNAAKYTAAGGRIDVRATHADGWVLIEVADPGIGIASDSLLQIFDMFTKVGGNLGAQQSGLGIGLNLVRRLVELHGGSVVATSAGLGKGSQFRVSLPLASATEDYRESRDARDVASAEPSKVKVLLVDDNVDAAATLSSLLELEAHTTKVANSGPDALQLLRDFKPDIIFLDIGMPGMNGYEVAEAIRRMPDLGNPVLVALTGWGGESDRTRSKNAGFDEHLTKPADIGEIEKLLANLHPHNCSRS